MQYLEDTYYGIKKGTTFYKNPSLTANELNRHQVSVDGYRSTLDSKVVRYGITAAKRAENDEIHASLFGTIHCNTEKAVHAGKPDTRLDTSTPSMMLSEQFDERFSGGQTDSKPRLTTSTNDEGIAIYRAGEVLSSYPL